MSLGTKLTKTALALDISMVKEIARLHKGRMEVESTPGIGSCFTFILPDNKTVRLKDLYPPDCFYFQI